MTAPQKNILIAGLPGSGKTTLILTLAEELRALAPVGFVTAEIREQGVRKGFMLKSFDGRTRILAHVDGTGPSRVGAYGVDVIGFEEFLGSLPLSGASGRLVIIDEIGKMECLSPLFRGLVGSLLDSPTPLLATVALRGTGFIEQVKRRPDIVLSEITAGSRARLADDLAARIRAMLPA